MYNTSSCHRPDQLDICMFINYHDLFLTLTKCFHCLNLTIPYKGTTVTVLAQNRHRDPQT